MGSSLVIPNFYPAASRLALAGLRCIADDSEDRPSSAEVLLQLKSLEKDFGFINSTPAVQTQSKIGNPSKSLQLLSFNPKIKQKTMAMYVWCA